MAVPPSVPPDRPTEPLRPTRPAAPVVEERVLATPAVDPNVILLRIEDAIEGLRTWLVIVGIVALAALGVAVYALATDDEGDGRGASRTGLASDERVTQLENRIDRISRQVQDVRSDAGNNDTDALGGRIDALEKSVETLSGQASGGDATQAVEQLSGRVDELSKAVDDLKSAQPAP